MPLVSYRLDPESGRWKTDVASWQCAAAPQVEGDTWQEVYHKLQAWLQPMGPINSYDSPSTPTSRLLVWHGTCGGATAVASEPSAPGGKDTPGEEVKPVDNGDGSEQDDDDDGAGMFSLFD